MKQKIVFCFAQSSVLMPRYSCSCAVYHLSLRFDISIEFMAKQAA
jgi:hypothetical protein